VAEGDTAVRSEGLARDAIGLREVLFQSITHMAPAAAVAFSIIVGAGFAGGALPLVASHNQGTTGWPRIWDHLPGPRNDPWQ